MLNLSLERTIFNIEHFRKMNEELDVFPSIHESLESNLLGADEGEFEVPILGEIFDVDWLEDQFFLVLEDVLSYTKGERESLTAKIDFSDRKDLLEEFIMEESLPPGEMESISGEMGEDDDFPDALYLEDLLEDEKTKNIFSYIILVRTYSPIVSYVVLAVFLLLMLLFAGFLGGLKWFGINMFISGFIFLIFLFSIKTSLNLDLLGNFIQIPVKFGFVISLFRYTFEQMIPVPIVYCLCGLFIFVFSWVFSFLRKKKV